MHGWRCDRSRILSWTRFRSCMVFFFIVTSAAVSPMDVSDNASLTTMLAVKNDRDRVTLLECRVTIGGTLTTPTANGERPWDLESVADFRFLQRILTSDQSGPAALQAIRRYSKASAVTRVGDDHETTTALPRANSLIAVRGTEKGLSVAAEAHSLTRGQCDLLQMPCDPLLCASLLPSRSVAVGEKWNTDPWVLLQLTGLEAATDHSLSCELSSLHGSVAEIHFTGKADGAVLGSASAVECSGTLMLSTSSRMATRLICHMKEKRSAGPVSAGLDAAVNIEWTQSIVQTKDLPSELDDSRLHRVLALQTPWRLNFRHSREWHIVNQTDQVVMLRQIRDGALISQCNISPGVVMPPGQHTPDADYRSDVESAIQARGGQVIAEETVRSDDEWRVRHVRASGSINDLKIVWDYYLCSAASGDQFSLLFSHSESDAEHFNAEPERILSSLSLARRRGALPFQR